MSSHSLSSYMLLCYILFEATLQSNGVRIPVTGNTEADTKMTLCPYNKNITSLDLKCASENSVLHIINLKLSYVRQCNLDVVCITNTGWLISNVIRKCDGKVGSCHIDLFNQSNCISVNHIDISIRCIHPDTIHPICPFSSYSEVNKSSAAVLTTPDFILRNMAEKYNPSTDCECVILPSPTSKIYIQLLMVDIEPAAAKSTSCNHDWLVVGLKVFCGLYNLLDQRDTLPPFPPGDRLQIKFHSDDEHEFRGSWISITTNGTFDISCKAAEGISTTTTPKQVNECLMNNGGCEQICNYTGTRVSCSCRDGYSLEGSTRCAEKLEVLENQNSNQESESKGLSVGGGAGIGLGVLVGAAAIITGYLILRVKVKKRQSKIEGEAAVEVRSSGSTHAQPNNYEDDEHIYSSIDDIYMMKEKISAPCEVDPPVKPSQFDSTNCTYYGSPSAANNSESGTCQHPKKFISSVYSEYFVPEADATSRNEYLRSQRSKHKECDYLTPTSSKKGEKFRSGTQHPP